MNAARLYSREDVTRKLAPYKCTLIRSLKGFELWETGWGEPFTLSPEEASDEPYYDEQQIRRALVVMAQTMPTGWNGTEK